MALHHFTLACLLSFLPGPPSISFQDAYLQLLPLKIDHCPKTDLAKVVRFELYTRHNPLVSQTLLIGDDRLLKQSYMDFSLPTVIFFHAFFESSDSMSGRLIRQAYTLRGDHNIIMVSAPRLIAGPWYFTSVQNTRVIGIYAARFMDYLYSRGLKPSMLHLVGLSLGGQAAGVAGGSASQRPGRITGLDPALPLFPKLPLDRRLDREDADFVDIIHTDAGIFGISAPMGHADFYVNGGKSPQPGCELEVVIPRLMLLEKFFCSHWRSYQLYAESVINPKSYPSVPCGSSDCDKPTYYSSSEGYPFAFMGFGLSRQVRGIFYAKTSGTSPYTIK